jgi:hypothetical protein
LEVVLSPLRVVSLLVALAVSAMYAAVPAGLPAGGGRVQAARADKGDPALLAHASRLETRLARHDGRSPSPARFPPPPALPAGAALAPPAVALAALAAIARRRPASSTFAQPKTCRGPPAADVAL